MRTGSVLLTLSVGLFRFITPLSGVHAAGGHVTTNGPRPILIGTLPLRLPDIETDIACKIKPVTKHE